MVVLFSIFWNPHINNINDLNNIYNINNINNIDKIKNINNKVWIEMCDRKYMFGDKSTFSLS